MALCEPQSDTELGCNRLAQASHITPEIVESTQLICLHHPSHWHVHPAIYIMDFWLRNVGCGIANAGKIIHDNLNGFGQNAGNALDAWGKHVGKDLDPSHPVHIAMTKTGEFSFGTARQTLRSLDHLGQQTEKSVTEAYNHAHHHISQVNWDALAHEVRRQIENSAKDLGIAVSAAATHVFSIAESDLPDAIKHWIAEHAGQTAFIVVAGVVFFAPFLIRVPVLMSLGFAASGVAAGTWHPVDISKARKLENIS